MANILLAPENFAAAQWQEIASTKTIVGNESIAPDNTTTADEIVDNGGGGQGFVGVQQAGVNIALSTVHTYSIFCKPNGNDWIYLDLTGMGSLAASGYINAADGTVGALGASVSSMLWMPDQGNGFNRVSMTFTSDASDGLGAVRVLLAEGSGDQTVDLDNGSSMYFWGAYLNEGATAETYISEAGLTVPLSGFAGVRGIVQDIARDLVRPLAS